MKASQIKESVKLLTNIKQPTFVWGAPGVGKSCVVAQVAQERGLDLIDIRAVLLDPVDLRGIPHVNGDNRAHWCVPAFLPNEGEGILFLDELTQAPSMVQAALYQLVLDRKLGEYTLPDGWVIVAASNRDTDRAATNRMPTPLANRFVHLEFDVDLDDWTLWALDSDICVEIIAFLRWMPNLLHAFDPKKNDEKAFPSPRSWEFVSNILKTNPPTSLEYELIAGTVGKGTAADFTGFLRIYQQLPDLDDLLAFPETADVPSDPATLYAICGALIKKMDDKTADAVIRYADRLPTEFSVLLVCDCIKRCNGIPQSYNKWAIKNAEVMI